MSRSMGMDAFLGHQTRSGNNGQFLRGWRKRNPAQIDVVLNTNAPIVALWQHGLPRIYEQKDDNGGETRRVFGGTFNCLEDESVLLKQYRRDRQTGERLLPPILCPVCRLLEAIHMLYRDGELGFAQTLFRWEGDDPNETQELTVGGMLNLYGRDNLTDSEKRAMREAGISKKESWKENSWAKCNYLFSVVDVDEPENGVQLAIETTALGDATKECIHAQMTSMGEEEGNPMLKPYAIRWEHHPNAKEFNKRYKAIAMPRIVLSKQVMDLIEGEPPDIENVVKPGNITKLRADLEAHCVLDDPNLLPWDDIFGPAERAGYGEEPADESVGEEADAEVEATAEKMRKTRKKKAESEPPPPPKKTRKKKVEPEPEEEEEEVEEEVEEVEEEVEEGEPCEECGAPMAAGSLKCEACGAEYTDDDEPDEEEEEEEPEPEPPPKKKAPAKKAPAKKAPAKKAPAKKRLPF